MAGMGWSDPTAVVRLRSGLAVRGRRLSQPGSPADFSLLLCGGPMPGFGWSSRRVPAPGWPCRRVRWPDFGLPSDRADALAALHDALARARAGSRVEIACRGGIGRTGTALAALAILDGDSPAEALRRVRDGYHPRAVETPWQHHWLRTVS